MRQLAMTVGARLVAAAALAAAGLVVTAPGSSGFATPGLATETAVLSPASSRTGHGHLYTAWPGADLRTMIQRLRPGDTLQLKPGTYTRLSPWRAHPDILRPRLAHGWQGHRITITAADPRNPPLLVGMVQFDDADYWTISHIRIEGTIPRTPGLFFNGGRRWVFARGEVFGAARTGALANVAIEGATADGTMPTGWQFTRNCVHGGGDDRAGHPGMMHQIYVTAQGDAYGQITHNVLYDTPDGSAVKVGFGGHLGALGASDVLIAGNTMIDNGRQVLLFGRVDRVVIQGNVMAWTTYAMSDGRTRPAIYLNRLLGTGSVVSHNYVWGSNRAIFNLGSEAGSWVNGGGNKVRHRSPGITGGGCSMHATAIAGRGQT